MKIIVYGSGYVGLSNGLALARKNNVEIIDIDKKRIEKLRDRTIFLEEELSKKELSITNAIFSEKQTFDNPDLYVLALPTDYDSELNKFNTTVLDDVIKKIRSQDPKTPIVIKSTTPIGYTDSKNDANIIFSPEFLREGYSLEDTLNPSRVIFGSQLRSIEEIIECFMGFVENGADLITMSPSEAEAVKLFSNTYLATRVAFINEVSNFSAINGLEIESLIKGIGADPRIGSHYFYPSTGFGGYCLPKDSQQLASEYNKRNIKNVLFDSVIRSNNLRVESLINLALSRGIKQIYIKGVGHKPNVINQRESTKLKFAKRAKERNIEVIFIDDKDVKIDGFHVSQEIPDNFINIKELY